MERTIKYYDEGDTCPQCKKDLLVFKLSINDGLSYLICEGCNYDATEDEKTYDN